MNIKLKWLMEEQENEIRTVIRNKADCVAKVMLMKRVLILKNLMHQSLAWKLFRFSLPTLYTNHFLSIIWTFKTGFLNGPLKEEVYVAQPEGFVDTGSSRKVYFEGIAFRCYARPHKKHLNKHFQTLIMSDALDTSKSTSEGSSFLGDNLSRQSTSILGNHFLKEQLKNGIMNYILAETEYQLADMLRKPFPEMLKYRVKGCMRCLTPADLEVLTNETA
ncbi:hypothetical protein Tco_0840723 [Tanacetum coccineum]|uniref:Uncharacterized protein n=1 Tax=Tanacetum coccineum TaxID=301880 RepID=A0ABQ5AUD7_9ASTR